jgi:hypothetical protein
MSLFVLFKKLLFVTFDNEILKDKGNWSMSKISPSQKFEAAKTTIMPTILMNIPVIIMSLTLMFPEANMIAFVGVATGSIKAKLTKK